MAEKTFLRIQLGRRLMEARKGAGKTGADAVQAGIVRSNSQISRLENGFRTHMTLSNIASLCDLYGLTSQEKYVIQQMFMKAEAEQEWWEPYSEVMFRNIALLFSLERYADKIFIYDTLVNGLFQTENYARMVHRSNDPAAAAKLVDLRMKRQADFWGREPLPEIQLMVCESALHGDCGQDQIDRLCELDQLDNVAVRYVPMVFGPQPSLLGPFTVLRFEGDDPDVVYSESISGARYEDRDEAVEAHLDAFASTIGNSTLPMKEFRRG
jgi:transcriptional regulator with XRE-family HTH domain